MLHTKILRRGKHTPRAGNAHGEEIYSFIYLQHLQHLQQCNNDAVFLRCRVWQTLSLLWQT